MQAARSKTEGLSSITRIAPPSGRIHLDLKELWEYRELIYFFAWRDLKIRYRQTAIGVAWAVIQPFMIMVVFTIFFGQLLDLPTQGIPAPVFYYSGLLPWTYFAGAIAGASGSVVAHQQVITKVYFPRLALPVAAILPGLLDFAVAFGLLVAMMIFYGISPGLSVLFLPLFLGLALITALGAGLWLSILNAKYRDVRHLLTFALQLWFFASPVVYPETILPGQFRWIAGLNPMAGVIGGFRWALTGGASPPPALFGLSILVVALMMVGGLWYFHSREGLIADVV